ncbi:hypothetical protein DM01DRAFT_1372562 [Hesseltinella vesiculosa]|uniref:RRM domain-containing protein n=1 Tax=Hesseltinella vesiculosa TaxID=101127 RepID=A0A1X2GMT2_9FUNG|nr:hypothetical protein DM01DRAFT_1372562 [Hesseltinella vesiculosa]
MSINVADIFYNALMKGYNKNSKTSEPGSPELTSVNADIPNKSEPEGSKPAQALNDDSKPTDTLRCDAKERISSSCHSDRQNVKMEKDDSNSKSSANDTPAVCTKVSTSSNNEPSSSTPSQNSSTSRPRDSPPISFTVKRPSAKPSTSSSTHRPSIPLPSSKTSAPSKTSSLASRSSADRSRSNSPIRTSKAHQSHSSSSSRHHDSTATSTRPSATSHSDIKKRLSKSNTPGQPISVPSRTSHTGYSDNNAARGFDNRRLGNAPSLPSSQRHSSDEVDSYRCHIGNLPSYIADERALETLLSRYHLTKLSKFNGNSYGFATFSSAQGCADAMREQDGTWFEGHHIRLTPYLVHGNRASVAHNTPSQRNISTPESSPVVTKMSHNMTWTPDSANRKRPATSNGPVQEDQERSKRSKQQNQRAPMDTSPSTQETTSGQASSTGYLPSPPPSSPITSKLANNATHTTSNNSNNRPPSSKSRPAASSPAQVPSKSARDSTSTPTSTTNASKSTGPNNNSSSSHATNASKSVTSKPPAQKPSTNATTHPSSRRSSTATRDSVKSNSRNTSANANHTPMDVDARPMEDKKHMRHASSSTSVSSSRSSTPPSDKSLSMAASSSLAPLPLHIAPHSPSNLIVLAFFGDISFDVVSFVETNLQRYMPDAKFRCICYVDITLARDKFLNQIITTHPRAIVAIDPAFHLSGPVSLLVDKKQSYEQKILFDVYQKIQLLDVVSIMAGKSSKIPDDIKEVDTDPRERAFIPSGPISSIHNPTSSPANHSTHLQAEKQLDLPSLTAPYTQEKILAIMTHLRQVNKSLIFPTQEQKGAITDLIYDCMLKLPSLDPPVPKDTQKSLQNDLLACMRDD